MLQIIDPLDMYPFGCMHIVSPFRSVRREHELFMFNFYHYFDDLFNHAQHLYDDTEDMDIDIDMDDVHDLERGGKAAEVDSEPSHDG